jgi:acetolactate synthase-1/2/3 large subunit
VKWSNKPVVVVGGGAYGYDLSPLYDLNVPILTSWQAADLIDNWHPNWFGRPGIYGQRMANKVLYEADQIVALGCRLSKWMIGHGGLRPEQQVLMCDVDQDEVSKFPKAIWVQQGMQDFIESLWTLTDSTWMNQCVGWRVPLIEDCHADTNGYINSYRFMERIEPLLRPNEIIVTDVGSLMCPVYQVLRLRPGQRLLTSGGLGEMGCAIPAAVGASFARGKGDVLAFVGDGGMMMNLQELETIRHNRLPVKIVVFANDGYSMIKGTYANVGLDRRGVDNASGLGMPDFRKIGDGWGFATCDIRTWQDFDRAIPQLLAIKEPALVVVHIDPEQGYWPRLQPTKNLDGSYTPARFDRMSPL